MSNVRVRARISLLPAHASGRTAPVRGKLSSEPQLWLPQTTVKWTLVSLSLPKASCCVPVNRLAREIRFWSRPGLEDVLVPGREWRIQEGPQLVGIGTVLEILEEVASGQARPVFSGLG